MALDPDQIADRRRLKRALTLWRVLGVIALAVALIAVFGGERLTGPTPGAGGLARLAGGDFIARFWVRGLIVDDPERDQLFIDIADDDRVKALIVRIDSPGGTAVGGEVLYESLRQVAEKKPVVAVMGQMATSAAYMTALGADRILARSGTLTGSIGVILQTANVEGLLGKLGIEAEAIKSSQLKGEPSPFEPLSEEGRAALRGMVREIYEMFVALVAERRNLSRDAVTALADGRVYTGTQSVENGMVDAIGGEAEAVTWLETERQVAADLPVREVEVERELTWLRRIAGDALGKTLFSERLSLDGLISLWHPELQ